MLGKTAQYSSAAPKRTGRRDTPAEAQPERKNMAPLFKRLFPELLALACDADAVPKQLFEPLMRQIIHWFTRSDSGERPETAALLDSILDGLCDTEDSAMRDFCADCVHEFFAWTIKQLPDERALQLRSGNILSLLKRIISMARHPSSYQRLGAALAFNHIYKVRACAARGCV